MVAQDGCFGVGEYIIYTAILTTAFLQVERVALYPSHNRAGMQFAGQDETNNNPKAVHISNPNDIYLKTEHEKGDHSPESYR